MRLFTIGAAAVLALIYFSLFSFASSGYGYAGYQGYHHGPSFWYFGGPHYYRSASVRNGSLGGPGGRGQGLHGGK